MFGAYSTWTEDDTRMQYFSRETGRNETLRRSRHRRKDIIKVDVKEGVWGMD